MLDVVGAVSGDKNPLNYWKVLKNLLWKAKNEILIKCKRFGLMMAAEKEKQREFTFSRIAALFNLNMKMSDETHNTVRNRRESRAEPEVFGSAWILATTQAPWNRTSGQDAPQGLNGNRLK